jgi:uncharacterized caspase-like protein
MTKFRLSIFAGTLGILVLTMWPSVGFAVNRVALVIGNSGYNHAPKLGNPIPDATAIADMFRSAGFDVYLRNDLDIVQFKRVLREFMDASANADIAVVYFAGHGIEVSGTNYLIPVDAKLEREYDARDEALGLDRVFETVVNVKRLRLIILDACRDNPFVKRMQRQFAQREITKGLAPVETSGTDTLIAFAAKAGSTAEDGAGGGSHSPYTMALLKYLPEPGLDVRIAFGRVRDEVVRRTRGRQEPYLYGSLGGDTISLVPAPEPKGVSPDNVDPDIQVRRDYDAARQVATIRGWDAFLAAHPSGLYAALAREERAKLVTRMTEQEKAEREKAERESRLQQARRQQLKQRLDQAGNDPRELERFVTECGSSCPDDDGAQPARCHPSGGDKSLRRFHSRAMALGSPVRTNWKLSWNTPIHPDTP